MTFFLATMAAAASPSPAAIVPAAVRAFIDRSAACLHWGGEEPYDPARRLEIERAVRALRCDTLDADARTLRRRHARQPAILRLIDQAGDGDL